VGLSIAVEVVKVLELTAGRREHKTKMLKGSSDGLSKAWKHNICHQPFFNGGKVRESNNAFVQKL
jgi:transcriptional regulator of met regulon